MPKVRRTEDVRLDKVTKTPEGFMVADAHLTRTGVFEYTNADGTTRRELRLPEHVFDAKSLESFDLKPLTLGHPAGNLDSKTAQAAAVGIVTTPRKAEDGEHVAARIAILDATAVAAVEGGVRQLSNGYTTTLVPVPNGEHRFADGTAVKADFYQTEIAGNHTAIVPRGRAGATASIRLDADGHTTTDQETDTMSIEALTKQVAELTARLDAATADSTKTKAEDAAKAAKLEGENAALKARLDAADKRDAEIAQQRADAEKRALAERVAPVLGKPVAEVLALESAAIKRAVLAKESPELALEGRSDAFVDGAFETLLSTRKDTAALAAGAAGAANRSAAHNDADSNAKLSAAIKAANERSANAWKTPS